MLIICTGASGLVGFNTIEAALRRGHKVIAITGTKSLPKQKGLETISADLTSREQTERLILDTFPDAIINCAAISSPAVVEKDEQAARKMNVELPDRLSLLANHVGARLIHISTDLVFDGKNAPYVNTDIPSPFNLYGQTKLDAEKAILANAAPLSVVLRISHVCGRGLTQKRSFDEKFFHTLARGEKVREADNETKRFLPVSHVAELLVELAERQNLSGIYHYAGSESLTRYEAARRICERFGLDEEKCLERVSHPEAVDFSLDCKSLLSKVKTPAADFERILDEIKIPDECAQWYENETGRKTIKRYKIL